MIGREGPGPERPGPDYPPEWDREPDDASGWDDPPGWQHAEPPEVEVEPPTRTVVVSDPWQSQGPVPPPPF